MNETYIKCDEETCNVVKEFTKKHMDFKIPSFLSKEEISVIQTEIRKKIQPFLKERLPYLKETKFKNPEFYALFMLIIVIDEIEYYDWTHINELLYFDYNKDESKNQYGFSMKENYFDSGYEDTVSCCCSKKDCSTRLTSKLSNDEYTFIIGSTCIEKTCIQYYKDKRKCNLSNDKSKKEREQLLSQGEMLCSKCNTIVDKDWKKLCTSCFLKEEKGYHTCNKKGCDNIIKNTKYKSCFECNNKKYKYYRKCY